MISLTIKRIKSQAFYFGRPQYKYPNMKDALKDARKAMINLQKRHPTVTFHIHHNGDYLEVSSGEPRNSFKEVE